MKERTEQMGSHIAHAKNTGIGFHAIPNAHVCQKCGNKRTSQAHKIKCYRNVNAVWW